jgi:hypothetical protein
MAATAALHCLGAYTWQRDGAALLEVLGEIGDRFEASDDEFLENRGIGAHVVANLLRPILRVTGDRPRWLLAYAVAGTAIRSAVISCRVLLT